MKKRKKIIPIISAIVIIIVILLIPLKSTKSKEKIYCPNYTDDSICLTVAIPICDENGKTWYSDCAACKSGKTKRYTEGECKTSILKRIINKFNN